MKLLNEIILRFFMNFILLLSFFKFVVVIRLNLFDF
jgi:hypothetical protein